MIPGSVRASQRPSQCLHHALNHDFFEGNSWFARKSAEERSFEIPAKAFSDSVMESKGTAGIERPRREVLGIPGGAVPHTRICINWLMPVECSGDGSSSISAGVYYPADNGCGEEWRR